MSQDCIKKIKIKKEGDSYNVLIDEKDISMNVKKINVNLDANTWEGQYALVDIQFLAEVDLDLEGIVSQILDE